MKTSRATAEGQIIALALTWDGARWPVRRASEAHNFFNDTFSPPRRYRSPMRPRSAATR